MLSLPKCVCVCVCVCVPGQRDRTTHLSLADCVGSRMRRSCSHSCWARLPVRAWYWCHMAAAMLSWNTKHARQYRHSATNRSRSRSQTDCFVTMLTTLANGILLYSSGSRSVEWTPHGVRGVTARGTEREPLTTNNRSNEPLTTNNRSKEPLTTNSRSKKPLTTNNRSNEVWQYSYRTVAWN